MLNTGSIADAVSYNSIVRMGVGYDRLDRSALSRRGVTVCNVPGTGVNYILMRKH